MSWSFRLRPACGLLVAFALGNAGCGRVGLKLLDVQVDSVEAGTPWAPMDASASDGGLATNDSMVAVTDAGGDGGASCANADGDALCDEQDNCLAVGNDDQSDLDADGQGDACDDDDDGDGVNDGEDGCPTDPTRSVVDACGCNVTPPPQRIARWTLDETSGTTASESTGTAPSGVLTNFPSTPWTQGQVGGGLSFDGVDDYVEVGAAKSGVRSIAFWIKPTTTTLVTSGTAERYPSAVGPQNGWSSPQNAYSVGGGAASIPATGSGDKIQHWGGFGLADRIPAGATIVGITLRTQLLSPIGVLSTIGVELSWDGGVTHTETGYNQSFVLSGGSVTRAFGGEDQLWGHTWQPSDFTDENFRVRYHSAAVASTGVSSDFVSVQVKYADFANPRDILNLSDTARIAFVSSDGTFAATGWPGATSYVNGVAGSALSTDWNHVLITSESAVDLSQLQFGDVTARILRVPFEGILDDVTLFGEAFTPELAALLFQNPACEVD